MSFKRKLRDWVARKTGLRVYKRLPRGVEFSADLATYLPGYQLDLIFDVGANEGQSARRYLLDFPFARIHSFEPVSTTFQRLQHNLSNQPRVQLHHCALGASKGRGTMVKSGRSEMFFLNDPSRQPVSAANGDTEQVEILPLDEFCHDRGIGRVGLLKIDTEGADLEVLKGAERLLSEQSIDFVEVEAGMNPGNQFHVPFEKLKSHLEDKGYRLFAIYEQVHEWPSKRPHLRRSNPLFIASSLIERFGSTPNP